MKKDDPVLILGQDVGAHFELEMFGFGGQRGYRVWTPCSNVPGRKFYSFVPKEWVTDASSDNNG